MPDNNLFQTRCLDRQATNVWEIFSQARWFGHEHLVIICM